MLKNIFLSIILVIFLSSCSGKNKDTVSAPLEETEIEGQMIEAYKEAVEALKEGDTVYASKKFNEAENLFPQAPPPL